MLQQNALSLCTKLIWKDLCRRRHCFTTDCQLRKNSTSYTYSSCNEFSMPICTFWLFHSCFRFLKASPKHKTIIFRYSHFATTLINVFMTTNYTLSLFFSLYSQIVTIHKGQEAIFFLVLVSTLLPIFVIGKCKI